MAQLGFFIPPPRAATGNRTHLSSVAPPRGTLIQDTLPTELPLRWQVLQHEIFVRIRVKFKLQKQLL